jgi:hypothetical protein
MKEIIFGSFKEAHKLGSFVFACLAIVIWVGVKALLAFFQDGFLHSLQEWLLSRKLGHHPREATSQYRVVAKREEIRTSPPEKAAMI